MASRKLRTGENQRSKRGHHTRSINTNIIATNHMRPIVTVGRITRSVTWNGNAARSQIASTGEAMWGCARGKYRRQ